MGFATDYLRSLRPDPEFFSVLNDAIDKARNISKKRGNEVMAVYVSTRRMPHNKYRVAPQAKGCWRGERAVWIGAHNDG